MRMTGAGVRVLMAGTALMVCATMVAGAQGTGTGTGTGAAGRGRAGRGAAATPERREQAKERAKNATPEQKTYAKALAEEQKSIRAQVKAGTLDRKSAADALKAWRAANPAPKKPETKKPPTA